MPSHASRFTAHLTALTSGALAVVFVLTLPPGVGSWIVLGLGALAVIAALSAFAMPDQGGARMVEVLLMLAGGWTIVASRVFSDPHVTRWVGFADGVALWALGTLGLLAHELLSEGRLRSLLDQERYRQAMTRSRGSAGVPRDPVGG